MSKSSVIVQIQPEAALKPPWGAPCNGCGVCCLVEPCPLGILLSGRRSGSCLALRWEPEVLRYRCGAVTHPNAVLVERLPASLQWSVPLLTWVLGRLARRWVAVGIGCDCDAHPDIASEKV